MRDDPTPSANAAAIVGAKLDAFRQRPHDEDLYRQLSSALRHAGEARSLAEIGELHAPHQNDAARAADIWSESGEARLRLGDGERGEYNLRRALALDPGNQRATIRLAEHLVASGRIADAAEILEAELRELRARSEDNPPADEAARQRLRQRRAQGHSTLAQLWETEFGRLDRALYHWHEAWRLEPERTDAAEAARALYRSLGDGAMVARLYEAELELLADKGESARRAAMHLELGRIRADQGEAEGAAHHLEQALALDEHSLEARQALAQVYTSPAFAARDDLRQRAVSLWLGLGQAQLSQGDPDGAIADLKRAFSIDPRDPAAAAALESALVAAKRWDDLAQLYDDLLAQSDGETRLELLRRQVELYEQHLASAEPLKRALEELAAAHRPPNPYVQRLQSLYRRDKEWAKLAALLEDEIKALEGDGGQIELLSRELLELATIAKEHLGNRERAAECLHRLLTLDPSNQEALARYGDHFRERRDWHGLAELLEFGFESAREAGAPPAELARQLEELAQLAELRLGDLDRAITTWGRVEELEPQSRKPREALRRLTSRAKMWQSLVEVLEKEAEAAKTPQERAEALRRIAQVYRERQVNPHRAIGLYEEVFSLFPDDAAVLKTLLELYEREGDDLGVAYTLRRQLELDVRKLNAEIEAQGGRAPTAREWPMAKRVERLSKLRRLASLYEQRLADVDGVVFSCTGLLEILPGDRDALERLERVLEKSGDTARLEQTLAYHVASATGPAERAKVLRQLARLVRARGDQLTALEHWEQALKVAPNDTEALVAAAELYEQQQRWEDLAAVLERSLMAQKAGTAPQQPAARDRAAQVRRYARVLEHRLHDGERAIRAWQKLRELCPGDREAIDALARAYEAAGRWRELAEVWAEQEQLYRQDSRKKAAQIAQARARLLVERLGAPAEAVKVLEEVLRELDPSSLEAHGLLRRLYEARGDFDAAMRVAEREFYLLGGDPQRCVAVGVEIALLCRDRLGEPKRALMALERVLEIDPSHGTALAAAAELAAQLEDWRPHVAYLERRVAQLQEPRERSQLMLRIAQALAEPLGDRKAAFNWYLKAQEHTADAATTAELRRAAEAYGLWDELAGFYQKERERLLDQRGHPSDEPAYVAATRELAAIAEHRLGDKGRAVAMMLEAFRFRRDDDSLLAEIERVASETNDTAIWQQLLAALALRLEVTADVDAEIALRIWRARIRYEKLGEDVGTEDELLAAFAVCPEREEIQQAMYALADRSGNWDSVLAVEEALAQRARDEQSCIEALRRKARLIEEKLAQPVRAFRIHLVAFLIAPEDPATAADLWRLAREIGSYRQADRRVVAEPPAAPVTRSSRRRATTLGDAAAATPAASFQTGPEKQRREPTLELAVADMIEAEADSDADPLGEEHTMPLDISELEVLRSDALGPEELAELADLPILADEAADPALTADPDDQLEGRTEDLLAALGSRSEPPQPAPPPSRRTADRGSGPPPPPPRPPEIRRLSTAGGTPRPVRSPRTRASSRLPALPERSYASPWEELAAAYGLLPAPDRQTKLKWLFRAAEVWESGAGDVHRALTTLGRGLALAPADDELRARLFRLASDHSAWDTVAELYEAEAEKAPTGELTVSLLLDVAEIRAREGQSQASEALYRRILGMRPDDAATRERLEALYRLEERWVDLAASLEERTDPRLGSAVPPAERAPLLAELAAVYSDSLGRPHDAIEALVKLRDLAPEDTEVLGQLAALYSQVGRWSQVIGVLSRIAEIKAGDDEARDALRRIAHIYETELELPDRAIDAYSLLVTQWPDDTDAYAALDSLYEAHAKWKDLAETLRRRAALARDPGQRAELLRRRAAVLLDWLNAPEEAAASLRHARTLAPDDARLADDLVRALVQADRAREGAAVLEGQIEARRKSDGGEGDIAALYIRLATLRADALDDAGGARNALDEALRLVPNHPTALTTLARLAETQEDPRAYAEAKLLEAEGRTDIDAKVEALMSAGVTLAERCGDIEAARRAFEQILDLRPYHSGAIWALAGLVEQGGDLESAAALLQTRLKDSSLQREERTRIYTQLAALARKAGVDAAAERHLEEALRLDPDYLPAIFACVDLFSEAGRFADLETFLTGVIARVEKKAPAPAFADLQRRLALAYENLGREADAYQVLLAADRLHRGNLLIKLALGENRYRARRWREAALHLSSAANHPDANQHPQAVAAGLYHAALAEIRTRRPERAPALYERALELKPDYVPVLRALAELAMEQGDFLRAADLLSRQAAATTVSSERMRLYEALGDLALRTLGDKERARGYYDAAVSAADPLEAKHLPLLEKVLELHELAGDMLGAARAAELMASFGHNAAAKASRLVASAQSYAAAGDPERARRAAERAVDVAPYDTTALTVLSELLLGAGDYDAAAAVLGRALSGEADRGGSGDESERAQKSLLWARLGRARRARGDLQGAIPALERSIEICAEADGAIQARRDLVDLWRQDPSRSDLVLAYAQTLASASLNAADVTAYGSLLHHKGELDSAACVLAVARELASELGDKDRELLAAHTPRVLAPDESYRGIVTADDRAELVADDDDHPLAQIFATLWAAAPLLWSDAEEALERCGVVNARRLSGTSHLVTASMFPQVATALDIPATILYLTEAADAPDVQAVCVSPAIIVLGPRCHLGPQDELTELALRFLLGRAAELSRPERIVATGLPREYLEDLLASLIRVFGDSRLPFDADRTHTSLEHDETLRTTLPVKVRTALRAAFKGLRSGDLDAQRFVKACERAADRAGLLVCGDLATAMRYAAALDERGQRQASHLFATMLQPRFLPVREKLGLAAKL